MVDGAEGNQRGIDAHRPDTVRILDCPPGAADPVVVLARLRDLARELPPTPGAPPPAARAPVSQRLAYVEKRAAQRQYAAFPAAGYPIGRGARWRAPTRRWSRRG
jgi:hypothetical protein